MKSKSGGTKQYFSNDLTVSSPFHFPFVIFQLSFVIGEKPFNDKWQLKNGKWKMDVRDFNLKYFLLVQPDL